MERFIKLLINKPLSPEDIYRVSGYQYKMILYSDIYKYKTIDQLFGNNLFCIILYEYKPQYGHYILLFKYDNNKTIEYFDSIYKYPDFVLTKLPEDVKNRLNENNTYLVNLLEKSRYEIEYNDKKLQTKGSATCGRWCGLRMRYYWMELDKFNKYFRGKKKSPDYICTELSYKISGI